MPGSAHGGVGLSISSSPVDVLTLGYGDILRDVGIT